MVQIPGKCIHPSAEIRLYPDRASFASKVLHLILTGFNQAANETE